MADPESHDVTTAGAIKNAIEQALVAEAVRRPEESMSFTRIFNKDAPDFSRAFSRGGIQLQQLTVRDLTTMDDEVFTKFADRLRSLQEIGRSETSEAS